MENAKVIIKNYEVKYENALFDLFKQEGEDWKEYWEDCNREKFKKVLINSINYVLLEEEKLCGYIRCKDDDGYGIYIYGLVVDKACRGKNYGHMLIQHVCANYPNAPTYVMSGVDAYYEKLGYKKEGTIFIANAPKK